METVRGIPCLTQDIVVFANGQSIYCGIFYEFRVFCGFYVKIFFIMEIFMELIFVLDKKSPKYPI